MSCAATWCLNRCQDGVRMIKFPLENAVELEDWIAFAKCAKEEVDRRSKLCLGHFPHWQVTKIARTGELRLRPQAVPSLEDASELDLGKVELEHDDRDDDAGEE